MTEKAELGTDADLMEYEVVWQVFGTRMVKATSEEDAYEQVSEWLEEDHDLTAQVASGWDYRTMGVRSVTR